MPLFENTGNFVNNDKLGYQNPTFWSENYSQYAAPSAAERGNQMSGSILDPFGDVSGFYNDIMGFTSQSREFAHQEYMTDKENWWNSAQEQMKRARAAGINPNTAAAGIVGAGTSSIAPAGGSASPVDSPSSLIGAASGVAQTSSNIALQSAQSQEALARADDYRASARNADRLADADILAKAGTFAEALTKAGTPEIAAMELGLSIVRNGLDGIAAGLKGDSVCRLIDTKQQVIEADFSKTWKEIEQLEKLLPYQVSEAEKKNALLDIEKRKQDAITQREELLSKLWIDYNGDPYLDLYKRQYQLYHDYGPDSPQYQGFLQSVKDFSFNQSYGQFSAESEFAYKIANARQNGSNVADMFTGHVGGVADFANRLVNHGVSFFNSLGNNFGNWLDDKLNAGDYKSIRAELKMILDNAYIQLENELGKDVPDSNEVQRVNEVITSVSSALQLSNKELKAWYEKSNH